jgi:hypothetical protein
VVTGLFLFLATASCFDKVYVNIKWTVSHLHTHTHTHTHTQRRIVVCCSSESAHPWLQFVFIETVLEWWNTCFRCQYYQYVEVSNRNTGLSSARQCFILFFFFCGLCKRNDQYKWYPNSHISTPVGHFRVTAKRNWLFYSLWYWHDTVYGLCILHCVACAMASSYFRIFGDGVVVIWAFVFVYWVTYVFCVCGIHMFSFVTCSFPIVLSVVPCIWVFSNMRFAWLELVMVVLYLSVR